jgi:hypothetical protein
MTTDERRARMRRTPDELARVVAGHPGGALAQRPAPGAWSVAEVVCHLRDVEEFYLERVRLILGNDEPALPTFDPDRWAEERQYRRQDGAAAVAAFAARRRDTLAALEALRPEQWERAGLHARRGRMSVVRIVHGWAKHDDGHLEQIRRALAGAP